MQTNTVLTLYQKSVTSNTEHWTRVFLGAVHWENRKAANVIASGLLEADSVSVWVPTKGEIIDIKAGDVMVNGEVTDEVDASTFTITDLKKKYADVVVVKSVDRYDFGSLAMRHVRIGAS